MKRSVFTLLALVLVAMMLVSCGGTGKTAYAQVPATITEQTQAFDPITTIGPDGATVVEFDEPKNVAVDSAGNIYVYDGLVQIQKFDKTGKLLGTVGEMGANDGQFVNVKSMAVGPDDSLYIADKGSFHVVVFNSKGEFVKNIGERGEGDGQFKELAGLAFNSKGELFVGCGEMGYVQVFDKDGKFVRKIGEPGENEGQITEATWVAVDSQDRLYVVDGGRAKVMLFGADGKFIREIGEAGEEISQFVEDVEAIAIDAFDRVYVVDQGGGTIKIFDKDGNFVASFGGGVLTKPQGLALDLITGHLIVTDEGANQVFIFDLANMK